MTLQKRLVRITSGSHPISHADPLFAGLDGLITSITPSSGIPHMVILKIPLRWHLLKKDLNGVFLRNIQNLAVILAAARHAFF